MSGRVTQRETLEWAARGLAKRGLETPRLDAELLLAHALGTDRVGLYRDSELPLSPGGRREFLRLLVFRRRRVPVAYLIRRRAFHELTLEVGPGVLIPRPETELLVDAAVDRLAVGEGPAWILDLGTGSGNIALAVARQVPRVRVVALDLSAEALAWCQMNLRANALGQQVSLVRADLGSAARLFPARQFDLVISNPPYVEGPPEGLTRELSHEPELALIGQAGPFPHIYQIILAAAEPLMRLGGSLLVEVGQGQADTVSQLMADAGCFTGVRTLRDLASIERVVEGWGARAN